MIVTSERLQNWNAGSELIEWFGARFSGEVELEQVFDQMEAEGQMGFAHWFFMNFEGRGETLLLKTLKGEDRLFDRSISVAGDITLSGQLVTLGSVWSGEGIYTPEGLKVGGDLNIEGDLMVSDGDVMVGGDFNVEGDVYISGRLRIGGSFYLPGSVKVVEGIITKGGRK